MNACPVCDHPTCLRPVAFSEAGWACSVCNAPYAGWPARCCLSATGVSVARRYWEIYHRPVAPAYFGEPEPPIETEADVRAWAVFCGGVG